MDEAKDQDSAPGVKQLGAKLKKKLSGKEYAKPFAHQDFLHPSPAGDDVKLSHNRKTSYSNCKLNKHRSDHGEMSTPGSEGKADRQSVSFKGQNHDDGKDAPAGLSSMKQSGENTSAFTG